MNLHRPDRTLTFDALLAGQSREGRARLHDERSSIGTAGLLGEVARVAGLLHEAGARRGDRLALWLPNGLPWLATFLASARLGLVVVAVNTRFRSHDLANVLKQAGCRWLVYRPDYRGIDFRSILADVPADALGTLQRVFTVAEPGPAAAIGPSIAPADSTAGSVAGATVGSWHEQPAATLDAAAAMIAVGPGAGADDAVIFTTSGTTSLPKLVVHDQHGLVAHGRTIAQALAIDADSVVLLAAPLCGTFGVSTALPALVSGAQLVFDAGLNAADLAWAIARHGVTHTFCNNALLAQILDEAERQGIALASLQRVGFASFAPSLDGLLARGTALGIRMTGLYGSSELQALAAAQPLDATDDLRGQPGGRLLAPEGRVRARDPDSGALLPHGQAGAIEIRAPSVMRRYDGAEAATAAALDADGWFRTGDAGVTIDDRHFVFHSRLGDAMRLGGFLVNPKEIEDWITGRDDVAACQIVAVDHQGATVAVAFVIAADPAAAPADAMLQQHCRDGLARYKVPSAFIAIDAFPTVAGANGDKIQRHVLQDLARRRLAGTT